MTGRRMKTSERFMAFPLLDVSVVFRCCIALGYTYLGTRSHGHLTSDHDALAGFDSRRDGNVSTLALTKDYRAKLSCVVRLYHENERPLLADLSGFVGHQHRVFLRAQHQLHVDELAWPKMTVRVRNGGAQVDRAGTV